MDKGTKRWRKIGRERKRNIENEEKKMKRGR